MFDDLRFSDDGNIVTCMTEGGTHLHLYMDQVKQARFIHRTNDDGLPSYSLWLMSEADEPLLRVYLREVRAGRNQPTSPRPLHGPYRKVRREGRPGLLTREYSGQCFADQLFGEISSRSKEFRLSLNPYVILAAAGIQSPGNLPRRLCQLTRAGWKRRLRACTISANPYQLGWEQGLRIPAAARMTGDNRRPLGELDDPKAIPLTARKNGERR